MPKFNASVWSQIRSKRALISNDFLSALVRLIPEHWHPSKTNGVCLFLIPTILSLLTWHSFFSMLNIIPQENLREDEDVKLQEKPRRYRIAKKRYKKSQRFLLAYWFTWWQRFRFPTQHSNLKTTEQLCIGFTPTLFLLWWQNSSTTLKSSVPPYSKAASLSIKFLLPHFGSVLKFFNHPKTKILTWIILFSMKTSTLSKAYI